MRLLLCGLLLRAARGCLETQYEGVHAVRVQFWDCSDTVLNVYTFARNPARLQDRETWSATSQQGPRHLYSLGGTVWAFGDTMGGAVLTMKITSSALEPPVNLIWQQWCSQEWTWNYVLVQDLPVACTECGQNRVTLAGSNACQCRAGQFAGRDGVCTSGLSDAVHPGLPSGASAARPRPRSPWALLVVLGPLAAALQSLSPTALQ